MNKSQNFSQESLDSKFNLYKGDLLLYIFGRALQSVANLNPKKNKNPGLIDLIQEWPSNLGLKIDDLDFSILKPLYQTNNDLLPWLTKSRSLSIVLNLFPLIFKTSPKMMQLSRALQNIHDAIQDIYISSACMTENTSSKKNDITSLKLNERTILKAQILYNQALNVIQSHLTREPLTLGHMPEMQQILSSLQPFTKMPGVRKPEKMLSSLGCLVESDSCCTAQVESYSKNCSKHRIRLNYDGHPTTPEQDFKLKVPACLGLDDQIDLNGIMFATEEPETILALLLDAIHKSKYPDIISDSNSKYGGGVIANPISYGMSCLSGMQPSASGMCISTVLTLQLRLKHGLKTTGLMNSSDPKIIHVLAKHPISHKDIQKALLEGDLALLLCLGPLYCIYHFACQTQIRTILRDNKLNPKVELGLLVCPCCNHENIIYKQNGSNECTKCKILICLECGLKDHFGSCTPIDSASAEWMIENTKPCPICHFKIEKNDGCNHMTCKCGIHFCWICNQVYTLDDINDHYMGNNPFASCIGTNTAAIPLADDDEEHEHVETVEERENRLAAIANANADIAIAIAILMANNDSADY